MSSAKSLGVWRDGGCGECCLCGQRFLQFKNAAANPHGVLPLLRGFVISDERVGFQFVSFEDRRFRYPVGGIQRVGRNIAFDGHQFGEDVRRQLILFERFGIGLGEAARHADPVVLLAPRWPHVLTAAGSRKRPVWCPRFWL